MGILLAFLGIPLLIAVVAGIVDGITSSGTDSYDYDGGYGSDDTSNDVCYQHEDFFGACGGKSYVEGDKVRHTDFWGTTTGYSEKNGERIQHKTFFGDYAGYSIDKGDRIDHYNDFGVWQGSSKRQSDGSFRHEDIWGVEEGRSKPKP